jgi:hypothetical protein
MSADSFHAKVEQGMRKSRNLYDFDDFRNVVAECGEVKVMEIENFKEWKNEATNAKATKKPKLHDIKEAKFLKNDPKLYFKEDHSAASASKSVEFLKKKTQSEISNLHRNVSGKPVRGIAKEKLQEIKRNLLHLMPEEKRSFWNNLTETELVPLSNNHLSQHRDPG